MCVGVSVFAQITVGKLHLSEYQDPDNKHGALGGEKIITTKMQEIQQKWREKTIVVPLANEL